MWLYSTIEGLYVVVPYYRWFMCGYTLPWRVYMWLYCTVEGLYVVVLYRRDLAANP